MPADVHVELNHDRVDSADDGCGTCLVLLAERGEDRLTFGGCEREMPSELVCAIGAVHETFEHAGVEAG